MIDTAAYRFGAAPSANGTAFRFFAPAAHEVELIVRAGGAERRLPLQSDGNGWFRATDADARPGMTYGFRIDGADTLVPDPASRFQPEGVHGLSEIVDPTAFTFTQTQWHGRPWNEAVVYELHVGTFTPGGTYASAIERLDDLVRLGVTVVEIMPLAQWPGARNWGYDGVLPYAPAERYGRPEDLVRFIDAAHARGLAVFLDVVYNHFGPEGNYLHGYAPAFFTERYATPWGAAIDYASDDVRAFFIENARWWLDAYRFDGLRLDATQMIFDERRPAVLPELRATIAAWTPPGRHVQLVVENDHNDITLLDAGFDAQWNDDFHHAVHVLVTGDQGGYYGDYAADPAGLLARTLTTGYAYQGEPSPFRDGAPRGSRSDGQPLTKFVDFIQNHDQIGNRAKGERLSALAPLEAVRAAAAVLLLAPSIPLLFMGEEWAASTPFLFFCDFEPELAGLVTEGRRREFAAFPEFADEQARESIPDPSAPDTFDRSRLQWDERAREPHRAMLAHYTQLLALRAREIAPRIAAVTGRQTTRERIGERGLLATWEVADARLVLEANLGADSNSGFAAAPAGRILYADRDFNGGDGARVVRALVVGLSERPPTVPTATYRLQFTPQFGFRDAAAVLPYLRDLGVGHMYASPYLRARPGSMHGYDVVDPNALNPEVGTPAEHAEMVRTAQSLGLGQILDFVPNHMGIGSDNPWWMHVLEWGERSPYAGFFDIDWHPLKPELQGKVLVPTLGDHYGRILEAGQIALHFDAAAGTFSVDYYENRYPLAARSYAEILRRAVERGALRLEPLVAAFARAAEPAADAAEMQALIRAANESKRLLADLVASDDIGAILASTVEDYRVTPGDPHTADKLDALLQDQHYRLAYWRVAVDEINYRRFFDINDLAGLCVEDAEVLGQTHRLIFEFIAAGTLQGLRIDHVDGLYNPGGYCNLLKERADALGQPLYVVVEKILAPFERLRASWLIAGTTGYEFANLVNGLFVDSTVEAAFDRIYARAIGREPNYDDIAYEAKKRIMSINLASELTVLATNLSRIAASDRRSSDFTYNGLRDALMDVVAAFPVYRTYVVSEEIEDEDREFIEAAVAVAQLRSTLFDESLFGFIADALTVRLAGADTSYDRNEVLRFAMRFQQYTSPVMAKSIEDTVFYRYVRLISLNEVGGDPQRFGTSVGEFHAANAERAATRPHTMLATSTHDHKRGEDVRTRIDTLTETPGGWSRALRRWSRINRAKRGTVRGYAAPEPNDEYFLYQTLVGTWPAAWTDPAAVPEDEYAHYVERIVAYMQKAQREAKGRTSWSNPDVGYEGATETFIREILTTGDDARYPGELAAFVAEIAPAAMVSSLAQLVFKCTAPGIPDIYQGCELWDHSLVDPDNRRPVDYALRARMLAEARIEPAAARASWLDGRVKLFVTWKLLTLRAQQRALFLDGPYTPLTVSGGHSDRVIAYARDGIVVVAPRLVLDLVTASETGPRLRFSDETIALPDGAPARYRDIFTEAEIAARDGVLAVSEVLGAFPVSVLVPV